MTVHDEKKVSEQTKLLNFLYLLQLVEDILNPCPSTGEKAVARARQVHEEAGK